VLLVKQVLVLMVLMCPSTKAKKNKKIYRLDINVTWYEYALW